MMNAARLLLLAALAFAAGALLARRGGHNGLRTALQLNASAHSQHTVSRGTDAPMPTLEERFSRVVSTLQEGLNLKRRHDLWEAIADLNADEIAAMIDRAAKLPGEFSYQVAPALLERWFELDLRRAEAWVRAHPRENHYWNIWAKKSPETALAEVHLRPRAANAGSFLETAITTLAGPEKKDQAARLAALPGDAARDALLAKTMNAWAKTDAVGAFAFARTLDPGAMRQTATEAALREWAKSDPQRAAKEVTTLLPELKPGLTGNGTIAAIAGALSQRDPQAALEWLGQLPEEQRGATAYAQAAEAWAKRDPLGALAWCRENGVDPARHAGAVMNAAMGSKPLETMQWIQAMPSGGERDRWLEKAVTASKLSFPPIKPENAEVVLGWLEQLPADAQERAAYQLGWSSGHGGKIEEVRAWTERLHEPALRAAAVEAAVRYRFGGNPDSKDKLLAQFPSGPERDGALAGIAAHESHKTPERAAQTALEIADPAKRHDVLDSILAGWIERTPSQARDWIRNARTLPPDWTHAWLAEVGP